MDVAVIAAGLSKWQTALLSGQHDQTGDPWPFITVSAPAATGKRRAFAAMRDMGLYDDDTRLTPLGYSVREHVWLHGKMRADTAAAYKRWTRATVLALRPDGNVRSVDNVLADMMCVAIARYNGDCTAAARWLCIGRSTFYRKLAEFEIDPAVLR